MLNKLINKHRHTQTHPHAQTHRHTDTKTYGHTCHVFQRYNTVGKEAAQYS